MSRRSCPPPVPPGNQWDNRVRVVDWIGCVLASDPLVSFRAIRIFDEVVPNLTQEEMPSYACAAIYLSKRLVGDLFDAKEMSRLSRGSVSEEAILFTSRKLLLRSEPAETVWDLATQRSMGRVALTQEARLRLSMLTLSAHNYDPGAVDRLLGGDPSLLSELDELASRPFLTVKRLRGYSSVLVCTIPPPPDLEPGKLDPLPATLDPGLSGDLLGEGTYSRVFGAEVSGVQVAVKEYKVDLDQDFAHTREVSILWRLSRDPHPSLPCLIGFSFEGNLRIALPRYEPIDNANPVDLHRLLIEVARGLDHLHKNGIYHGDVKPANILLREGNHAVLCDFSISQEIDHQQVLGLSQTLGFRAPEIVLRLPHLYEPDIWALGITAHLLLEGRALVPMVEMGQEQALLEMARVTNPQGWMDLKGTPTFPEISLEHGTPWSHPLAVCLDPNKGTRPTARQIVELCEV